MQRETRSTRKRKEPEDRDDEESRKQAPKALDLATSSAPSEPVATSNEAPKFEAAPSTTRDNVDPALAAIAAVRENGQEDAAYWSGELKNFPDFGSNNLAHPSLILQTRVEPTCKATRQDRQAPIVPGPAVSLPMAPTATSSMTSFEANSAKAAGTPWPTQRHPVTIVARSLGPKCRMTDSRAPHRMATQTLLLSRPSLPIFRQTLAMRSNPAASPIRAVQSSVSATSWLSGRGGRR